MLRKFLRKRRVVQHSLLSDTVHLGKNILALAFYLNTDLVSDLLQLIGKLSKRFCGVVRVDNHHHIKEILYDGL